MVLTASPMVQSICSCTCTTLRPIASSTLSPARRLCAVSWVLVAAAPALSQGDIYAAAFLFLFLQFVFRVVGLAPPLSSLTTSGCPCGVLVSLMDKDDESLLAGWIFMFKVVKYVDLAHYTVPRTRERWPGGGGTCT